MAAFAIEILTKVFSDELSMPKRLALQTLAMHGLSSMQCYRKCTGACIYVYAYMLAFVVTRFLRSSRKLYIEMSARVVSTCEDVVAYSMCDLVKARPNSILS